jgi:hypothetical protein
MRLEGTLAEASCPALINFWRRAHLWLHCRGHYHRGCPTHRSFRWVGGKAPAPSTRVAHPCVFCKGGIPRFSVDHRCHVHSTSHPFAKSAKGWATRGNHKHPENLAKVYSKAPNDSLGISFGGHQISHEIFLRVGRADILQVRNKLPVLLCDRLLA